MKTKFIILLIALVSTTIQAQLKMPQPSPSSKINQVIGLTDVTLEYSRPSVRGRTIFGNLVPFGKKWRTGANENTKITFSTDVQIDNKDLKAGTYAVYSIPNKESWDIIFYSNAENWGLPQKWDDAKVALKTNIKVVPLGFNMETFTMAFGGLSDSKSGTLYVMWEQVEIGIKIITPTDKIATKNIEEAMSKSEITANDYFGAARYYNQNNKDLDKALVWIDKAIELKPEAFWIIRQKSLIQANMGDKKGAIKTAKDSLKLAEKSGNADYVKMNSESIAAWSK